MSKSDLIERSDVLRLIQQHIKEAEKDRIDSVEKADYSTASNCVIVAMELEWLLEKVKQLPEKEE